MADFNDWKDRLNPYPIPIGDIFPDIADGVGIAMMTKFKIWLDELGIDSPEAFEYFMTDYHSMKTRYKKQAIYDICERVAAENAKKYDMLIAAYKAEFDPIENYRRVEETTHTREPDITRERTPDITNELTLDTTQSITNNQTKTTTEEPAANGVESESFVSPFDTTGYKAERKTVTKQLSDSSVTESYEGDPDTVTNSGTNTTTTTGTETETETGTETTTIESTIAGNIGTLTTQRMLEEQLQIAAKMNIFAIIKKDIAAAVLVGVW